MTLRAALVLSAALHAALMAASFVLQEPRPEPPACVRVALAGVHGGADSESAVYGKAMKGDRVSDAPRSAPDSSPVAVPDPSPVAPPQSAKVAVPDSTDEPPESTDEHQDAANALLDAALAVSKAVSPKVSPTVPDRVPPRVRKAASRPRLKPAPDSVADPGPSPPQPAVDQARADSGPARPVAAPLAPASPVPLEPDPQPLPGAVPDTARIAGPCPAAGQRGGAKAQAASGHGDDAQAPLGGDEPSLMVFGRDGGPDIRRKARMNYPEQARRKGLQGRVLVLVHLDARGRVVDAKIKSGAGTDLDRAALQFARRCLYSPAMSQGRGVACRAVLPVTFRLRE